MNKSNAVIILALALAAVVLARFPSWSGQGPVPYEGRSDARITEVQAGRSLTEMPASMQEHFDKRGGKPGPLQAHRFLTPWLLSRMPAGTWREAWGILTVLSLVVMTASAWFIGVGLGGNWRYGAICAALTLATVGFAIGRIPWHTDTVVAALEFYIIALLVYKRWFWLSLALVWGVLCKESFLFLAVAIGAGLMVEEFIRGRPR